MNKNLKSKMRSSNLIVMKFDKYMIKRNKI